MAHLQSSTFGIPFAGDALILAYRPLLLPEPPGTLSETLSVAGPLIFPAADPQALFTLAQYQASGGKILNDQGRPALQSQPLAQVLEYYQQGMALEKIPASTTQYQDDEQSWQAFNTNNAPMVITWLSRLLNSGLNDTDGAPIPTPDGKLYTLASGWLWAMASPNPEHERLSAELAEFLSEGDFLAQWTSALGYLPPRASALQKWNNPPLRNLANEVVSAAQLLPSEDVLTSISPPLGQATVQILNQETDPATAAQTAVDQLTAP
jgi:ABC-type glycerol-3-phosphate transport system substrate-binding protein